MRAHLLALAALLAAPAAAEEGAYAVVRDWIAGCDNTRSCRAVGFPPRDTDGGALIVDRAAEGAARPVVSLRLQRPENDAGPNLGEGGVDLVADGRMLGRVTPGRNLSLRDGDEWAGTITDEALGVAVLDSVRSARELAIVRPDGTRLATISLDGASAALLFVDERQRRLGTRGALVRRGERGDGSVPAPPDLPNQPVPRPAIGAAPSAVPRAVQALFDAEPAETCNRDADPQRQPPQFYRLAGASLVGINCWAGAYQSTHAFYLVRPGSPPQRLALPRPAEVRPSEPDRVAPHLVTSPDFDEATGVLFEFSKGRGLGDCGSTAQWQWNGRAFVLLGYSVMPRCRGLMPEDWIVLHRTAEPPAR